VDRPDGRGFQETLAFLAQTPQRVAALVAQIPDAAIRQRTAPDAFSALEQVCHLRDIEQDGYAVRVRHVLDEVNPLLTDIDGAKLAAERNYQAQDLAGALAAFERSRGESLLLLHAASALELERTGHFEGSPPITLAGLAGMMREHDSEHLQQLKELCAGLPSIAARG
jgi:hypothetical protein